MAIRPPTWKERLEFRLQAIAFAGFILFCRLIGLKASSYIFGQFGRFLGPKLKLSNRAENNLKLAMPDLGAGERAKIIEDMWENLGRVLGEYPHLQTIRQRREDLIEVQDFDKALNVMKNYGCGIYISGHFANWELLALLPLSEYSGALVYRAPNNPYIADWLIKQRQQLRPLVAISKSKQGARGMMNILKNGGYLCALLDQKLSGGIPVPFFDKPALTSPTIARLALHHGCPVVPIGVERVKGTHFKLTVHEPILPPEGPDKDALTFELTHTLNKFLEDEVRARPAQWLWLHRRWGKATAEDDF